MQNCNAEKQHPLFSIVVPVYKAERYLGECVDSVLSQTYENFEIILVDDGSPDRSGELCDAYADKDSRVIVIHKENGGPTSARTMGAGRSAGQYILCLDSDDRLETGTLQRMNEIICKYAPDAILINAVRFGNGQEAYMDTLLPEGMYDGERMSILRRSLIYNDSGEIAIQYGLHMKVFRREQYLKYQQAVPAFLYKGEDLAVSAPLLDSCDSVYVSATHGYFYRDTPGSIMNSFKQDEIDQITGVAAYLDEALPEWYRSRIDAYVVTHLFDYFDRAMAELQGLKEYRALARRSLSPELKVRLKRSVCFAQRFNEKLAFYLVKHRLFTLLWILRHIYRPNR